MSINDDQMSAMYEMKDLSEVLDQGTPVLLPRDVTANVPREILLDVLGFVPQVDLNNDLLVSKKWHNIIKGGEMRLPQLQELEMDVHEYYPFSVALSNGLKTIKLMEGEENTEFPYLEKSIVKEASFSVLFKRSKSNFVALHS